MFLNTALAAREAGEGFSLVPLGGTRPSGKSEPGATPTPRSGDAPKYLIKLKY